MADKSNNMANEAKDIVQKVCTLYKKVRTRENRS